MNTTLKLNIDTLREDKFVSKLIETLLPNQFSSIGNFIEIYTKEDLLQKLVSANYEFMKYLPYSGLLIYRTFDIGIGYNKVISPTHLRELISLNKIDKSTYIYLECRFGNIYTSIKANDINIKLLLTDETYIIVHKDTREVYLLKIGKPTNPNMLFYKEHLGGVKTNLDKISGLKGFNSVCIAQKESVLDYIP